MLIIIFICETNNCIWTTLLLPLLLCFNLSQIILTQTGPKLSCVPSSYSSGLLVFSWSIVCRLRHCKHVCSQKYNGLIKTYSFKTTQQNIHQKGSHAIASHMQSIYHFNYSAFTLCLSSLLKPCGILIFSNPCLQYFQSTLQAWSNGL